MVWQIFSETILLSFHRLLPLATLFRCKACFVKGPFTNRLPFSNQRQCREMSKKKSHLDKRAFGYILYGILARHATILLSLHTFNSLSLSKNEICISGCTRGQRLNRYLINGTKVFDQFLTVLDSYMIARPARIYIAYSR